MSSFLVFVYSQHFDKAQITTTVHCLFTPIFDPQTPNRPDFFKHPPRKPGIIMSTAESLESVSSTSSKEDAKTSSPSKSSLLGDEALKSSEVDANESELATPQSPDTKENATEPESIEQKLWRLRSNGPSTPTELKKKLLGKANSMWEFLDCKGCHSVKSSDLAVLNLNAASCTLLFSTYVLDHEDYEDDNEDSEDTFYCQLGCFKSGSPNCAFTSQLPKHKAALADEVDGDFFLPLGLLVDEDTKEITRYVCALNISTNPTSMWLIYDYYGDDENGDAAEYGMYKDSSSYDREGNLIEARRNCLYEFDIGLLYEDVSDWAMDRIATNVSFQQKLGDGLRARKIHPPKELLQAI